jgi:glycosyltransferase involved in cell wall biosynthesis
MAKRPKKSGPKPPSNSKLPKGVRALCQRARNLAVQGQIGRAQALYDQLVPTADVRLNALLSNDRGVLAAQAGNFAAALEGMRRALDKDPQCQVARDNLSVLEADLQPSTVPAFDRGERAPPHHVEQEKKVRVAIISFLFNWPSTGGGNVHTAELAFFLARAGYEVRHFYARYSPWAIGQVAKTPFPSQPVEFSDSSWNLAGIQARFRQAIDGFVPDYVLITDSWNIKPMLAEAVTGYPYILRFQAMECLCPLNNVRLLTQPDGRVQQCPRHQLATVEECNRCLTERGLSSGSLHQAERALSGVGTPEYHARLLASLREAEAVLVVNSLTEAMISPYARCVRVVTAGMDPARFPWTSPDDEDHQAPGKIHTLFFAGLVDEWMKGFHVLHEACSLLWQRRRDFQLIATADPPGSLDEFTRFVGWLSQEDLPRQMRESDIVVVPTVAQEALGRTAVEAMAAGRPVIASRIGGLPATVADAATGLLCEPGDPLDLAEKIETLLDDPELRQRLGRTGRKRFEEHYSWDVIIRRHYLPLLRPPPPGATGARRRDIAAVMGANAAASRRGS